MERPSRFPDANQQMLHDWLLGHLRLLKADGVLMVPDISPLSTEQITDVLERISESGAYKRQTVSVPDRNGSRSMLRWTDGKAVVEASVIQDEPGPQRLPYGASVFMDEEDIPDAP